MQLLWQISFLTVPLVTRITFVWGTFLNSPGHTLFAISSLLVFIPFTSRELCFRFQYGTGRTIFFRHIFCFYFRPLNFFAAPNPHEKLKSWLLSILKKFSWEWPVNQQILSALYSRYGYVAAHGTAASTET